MKKLRLVLIAGFSQIMLFSFAQNVGIGITSPISKLHIKGSVNTTQLCIDANSLQGNTSPLIKFRSSLGKDLIWIHSDDSTNVFIGTNAGKENEIGAYPDGLLNTAIGSDALRSNISGSVNTALGGRSLYSNISGFGNVASGIDALYANISGIFNAAYGVQALRSNINGSRNTAVGTGSLYHNVDGNHNSAFGASALYQNFNGTQNTANGYQALYSNVGGSYNTAVGANSLYSNTGGSYNTAAGLNSLQANVSGVENTAMGAASLQYNTDGDHNAAFGVYALYLNTSGENNTALGFATLYSNTTGGHNTATGFGSLNYNTTGHFNTANGNYSMYHNATGEGNTASGSNSLQYNTLGNFNTATGIATLRENVNGHDNSAHGEFALFSNTTGDFNTAGGAYALQYNTSGNENTALGAYAGVSSGLPNLINATAIGHSATVNATNKVRIGNTLVSVIEGQVPFSSPSDGRFKENVKSDVIGLDFISKLHPVSYNFNSLKFAQHVGEHLTPDREKLLIEKSQSRFIGFIAQDVEQIIQETDFTAFTAVHTPTNEADNYSIAYSEFVVPLVKAVQELNDQNKSLQALIEKQDLFNNEQSLVIDTLLKRIEALEMK